MCKHLRVPLKRQRDPLAINLSGLPSCSWIQARAGGARPGDTSRTLRGTVRPGRGQITRGLKVSRANGTGDINTPDFTGSGARAPKLLPGLQSEDRMDEGRSLERRSHLRLAVDIWTG
ncbi:hypothetical protein NDU88_005234 [Pleurodeles waltl]|uniref:Uncharacterized protein n=1 Tax=Pleurodeles waltl TaxID=8319 RepID=A0AAV7M9E5_PLEWA|nr:hypothetical protein NDU88_005234 [Pleurodeles waltl]